MRKDKRNNNIKHNSFIELLNHEQNIFLLGCIIGIIFFLGIYGYSRIIPWEDDWLMAGGDLTQHYLGWCAYRISPWSFPLCLTDKLSYPITTSIMYTDSIPLWAVFFKVLSPLLPDTFQYMGLFGIVTYALQGGFGTLLLRKLKCSLPVCFAGGAIISFMTPILFRMFRHTSLASQWIILAALCLWLTDTKKFKHKYTYTALWCLLAFITVGLHLYLSAMFCVMLFGHCLSLIIKHTKIKLVIARFFLPIMSLILTIFIFGGFVSETNPSLEKPDFFTSNLTSLFDSDGWSKFGWPNFSNATEGQYEGFAYLGLGVIILILITLFSSIIRAEVKRILKSNSSEQIDTDFNFITFMSLHPDTVSLAIIAIISLLLGMGSTVTFLDKSLFSYPLPELILKLWGIFRATGRFTWIAMYIITVGAIVYIERNYKTVGTSIVFFALLLQFIDLYPFSRESHKPANYNSPLKSHVWDDFSGYSHIYMDESTSKDILYAITQYALDRDATINTFYFARAPKDMPYPLEISNDTLYIFSSSWEALQMPSIYEIDGLYVSASPDTTGNFYQVKETFPQDHERSVLIYPNSIGMHIKNAILAEDNTLYTDGTDSCVLFGPYFDTIPGTYNFTLNYEVLENINSSLIVGTFDICTHSGQNILQSAELPADGKSFTISGISFPDLSTTFESRVHNKNGAKLRIISIEITQTT